ncbi:MAG: EcsC family protein [Proteobacteria bacterium]|nr:EcsC family protein [Pseudomonadota bacterium]
MDATTGGRGLDILNGLYNLALNGRTPVFQPVEEMARDYYNARTGSYVINGMIRNQILLCTSSGILTGFGGLVTLPITVPVNVGSVMFIQMRMLACIAYMSGYDIRCDQCRTLIYAALAGVQIAGLAKPAFIKIGMKAATAAIKKIPGKVLIAINKKVGFRLFTKSGSKGIVNLGKMVPFLGAAVGGVFDNVETRIIAKRGYRAFVESDFTYGERINDEAIILDDDGDER